MNKKNIIAAVSALLLLSIVFFTSVYVFSPAGELQHLNNVEVREYEGENLSLITDFRNNSIRGTPDINIKKYRLEIDGLVSEKKSLKYKNVLKYINYSKVVTLNCVEGWSVNILWEGVLLKDLLNDAGIKPETRTVIFHAADGYSSSLPLDYVLDRNIILAWKINGIPLPPDRGFPFQVIAEDKWGYKWVRWVTGIELSENTDYRGYWEKAGYNIKGDLSSPKLAD